LVVVIIAAAVVGGSNALIVVQGGGRIEAYDKTVDAAGTHDYDCILVLGAAVYADGSPSPMLKDRLDVGIDLYLAGVAPKLLMSGDNGSENYNEVEVMKDYAISRGVPGEDVFCDHAGFSTYESMYRAADIFGVERMVVVTQTYHLYRAVYDAGAFGIDAVGVASDQREYSGQLHRDLREVAARTKDVGMCLFKLEPTFRGEKIDLHGSGDEPLP
jgi:vancomycin permeability regulator SanA